MKISKRKQALLFGGSAVILILICVFAWTSYGQFGPIKIHEPSSERRCHDCGQKNHNRVLRALSARAKNHGRSRALRRSLVHRRELGDQDHHRGASADGLAETSRRQLQHLDAAKREGMAADHQQADRPIPQRLRLLDGFWPHEDESENAPCSRRNLQNRFALRWRKQGNARPRLGNNGSFDPVYRWCRSRTGLSLPPPPPRPPPAPQAHPPPHAKRILDTTSEWHQTGRTENQLTRAAKNTHTDGTKRKRPKKPDNRHNSDTTTNTQPQTAEARHGPVENPRATHSGTQTDRRDTN